MRDFVGSRLERTDAFASKLWRETTEEDVVLPVEGRAIATLQAISNDLDIVAGRTWGLYGDQGTRTNIFGSQASEAWNAGHVGSMKVAIGVIDSGVDYTHPDLYQNIWLNQGEIPTSIRGLLVDTDGDRVFTFRDLNQAVNGGLVSDLNGNGRIDGGDLLRDTRWANGIDEAGNGYVDDLIGWDFANNDNNPLDDNGHGTHVAGTVGAQGGNGIGVAGMAWNAQIVPLKFMGANGSGYTSNAAAAVDYFTNARASNAGIDFAATNNSWGGSPYVQQLQDAINRAAKANILFVASAGNGGSDAIGDNNDITPQYPAHYSSLANAGYDNVISVAAITSAGALSGFSNYGAVSVDIGAPGSGIYSTTMGGGYGYMSGTSMAAPHVAGAIALLAAANPGWSAAQIRAKLMSSAELTTSLVGKTVTGGRLDVADALAGTTPSPAPAPTPTPTPTPTPSLPSIFGSAIGDTVRGTAASEMIYGVDVASANPGKGVRDVLYGGGGADIFVLSDSRGLFYDDGLGSNGGSSDRGAIMDFDADDRIQLAGKFSDYVLFKNTIGGVYGTTIYHDENGDGRLGATDEMVAHVAGSAALNLTEADFLFSSASSVPTPTPTTPDLFGSAAGDTVRGTAASERVHGVDSTGANPGSGVRDTLYGGGGADVFVLADSRGLFYDDGLATNGGASDRAAIMDFDADDKIQLAGSFDDYVFFKNTIGGVYGTTIYRDDNGDGRLGGTDEMIAHVSGSTAALALAPEHFIFG
jgi:subtilisin family serine protease